MIQSRLHQNILLHLYKGRIDLSPLVEDANIFVKLYDHRLSIFGNVSAVNFPVMSRGKNVSFKSAVDMLTTPV